MCERGGMSICKRSARNILKVFHRWSDEDLSSKQQPGLCFRDAFICTVDGRLQQLKKDARHGCYVSIPTQLLFQPSTESRRRYAGILLSAFAGSDGLKVLLDQCALVAARARQPDILHMVVGPGQDGKTLIFVDHMRAVFGSGFGCAPCTMLQTEREFQQQGANFIQCCYMVFDECRREQGLVEDLVKVFVGGGWLALRRNHEAETKYGHWSYAAGQRAHPADSANGSLDGSRPAQRAQRTQQTQRTDPWTVAGHRRTMKLPTLKFSATI